MSDKQSQISARQKRIAEEQAEIALLEALPDGLDIELAYRAKSRAVLGLKGDVLTAIRLLPPMAIEIRNDSWSQPDWHSLERPAQDGDICFPVWFSAGNKASWLTVLTNGESVSVSLVDTSVQLLNPPRGYEVLRGHHQTFYKRIPLLADSTPRTHSPAEVFALNWDAFFERQNYTAGQKQFANMVKAACARGLRLGEADLPPIPPATMALAGEELVILGGRAPSVSDYAGQMPALVKAGGFWKAFTPESAKQLFDFANEMTCMLQDEEDAFLKKTALEAVNLADEFIARFVKSQRNGHNPRVIAAWVSARLGTTVSITHRETTATGVNRELLLHRHWVSVGRWHEGWDLTLPAAYDADGFDWEYPSFVEYEAAGALFEKPLMAV